MSMIRFIPVGQITDPLTVTLGLSGASGTGKTYSALRIARGMAEGATGTKGAPIGFVDTENRRALHYKVAFPEMVHFDMSAVNEAGEMIGFGPERWIEVIDAAEAAKLPVLVIDSFSHAWEGVGGVLDLHAQTLDRLTGGDDSKKDTRSQLAWASVKPRYRRLIDRIVRAKCNIVICTRAKPVMQQRGTNARPTKTRRADVPWDPAADGDLMFEMTAMMILDPKSPGCPVHQIKCADQFKMLFDARRPMTEETGCAMAEWARGGGNSAAEKAAMERAREAARGGVEAFRAFWNTEDAISNRKIIRTVLDDCQTIAREADETALANDADPFAGSQPDPRTATDAELEATIRAELAARDAMLEGQE